MNNFKTFIASSLKAEYLKMREVLDEALFSLNNDPELAPLDFSTYRFECEGSNAASVGGVQNAINLKIEECQAFVLICDSNIGNKTEEEFRKALERFKRFLNPTFIMVLKKKGYAPCGENQKTYAQFKNDYLTIFKYNKDGSVEDDYTVYEFDFDTVEQAAEKLKTDLKEWITRNDHRPLFKAELGVDISPSFLYKDESRKNKCDERMYFRRNFDDMLDQTMMSDEQVIHIKGASLSGKTRALYQAIKNIPDAWFYKFKERHDETRLVAEINEIADYIIPSRCDSPLYLIFDDIHQMPSTDSVRYALERLLDAIKDKNIHVVTTSTSSDDLLFKPGKVITIKPLTRKEYDEAELFFRRFGLTVEDGYKEIGAMMIDLKGIKDDYNSFKSKVSDRDEKQARECLLYAIKASSIWHSLNIGNVENLFKFSMFMLVNECCIDEGKAKKLLFDNINFLISSLPGISCDEKVEEFSISKFLTLPKYINIEEYIYRYVFGELTFEDEMEMMNSILEYVCKENDEYVTVTLSKFSRRSENRKEISQLIYSVVMSIYNGEEGINTDNNIRRVEEYGWYRRLKQEIEDIKNEVSNSCGKSNEECSELCVYMAKIMWSKMLFIDSYEEAEAIFNSVPPQLQSLPMLGALIVKSSSKHERIRGIIEKKDAEKSFYIINKLIPFAADFDEAYGYFMKGESPYKDDADYVYSSRRLRELMEERQYDGTEWDEVKAKDINRQNFVSALNSLAGKVRRPDDLEKLLEVVRLNYVLLLDNLELAGKFVNETDCYSRDKLTMIDLISHLNFYAVRGAFINILTWGNHVPLELNELTDRIIQEFVMTSRLYTPGYKSKHTVSTIFNAFIEKCCNSPYKEVFEEIFLTMNVQVGGKMINLSDSFTYSGMMRVKDCKYMDSLDLYYNFIEPHSKDPESHLRITHYMLNEILKKVYSVSEYNKISRLFDENNVARDVFTYNQAMRNLSYTVCVRQLLPQMCKDNIEIDSYTLGTIISKAPNVKVAAGYFYPLLRSGIAIESKMVADRDVEEKLMSKIEYYTKEFPLEKQHYLWATLMETRCRNEEDREFLFRILEYLEQPENRSHIFNENDNGIIYNNCIKNRSFIRSYDEADDFISSKGITPDAYTLAHLIKIIINDYKNSDDYAHEMIEHLNGLYCANEEMIVRELQQNNTHIYNERFKAYRSYADRLSFVFIFPDGKKKRATLTPMEYLRYLLENKLPIDQYTFSGFVDIEKGQTVELLKEFIAFVNDNGLFVNHYAIDLLARRFKVVIPEAERVHLLGSIYKLPVKDNDISSSRVAVKIYSHGLCTLEEAFDMIDGNNTEKLYLYTQIITQFRKFELEKENKKKKKKHTTAVISQDFRQCMDLYDRYVIAQGIVPNVDILSNIANFATCRVELELVLKELEKYNIAPIPYIITPILRVSENLKDVKKLLGWYIRSGGDELGRPGSENEVDIILRGLNIIWRNNRNADVHNLICELTDYVLSLAPSSRILNDFPFFDIYKRSGGCLTQKGLCELLNCWPSCSDPHEINVRYLERLALLLGKYYDPDNDAIRPRLVDALTYVCKERGLNQRDLFNVLKPYPKLVFMLAEGIHVDGYDTYRLLVESWNEGFDRIPQGYAIDVLSAKLETAALKSEAGSILGGIYSKWDVGISVDDFLKSEDTLPTDSVNVTEYKENDKLRRKYLSFKFHIFITNRRRFNKKEIITLFVDTFGEDLVDSELLKTELSNLVKQLKLKFDDFKPILYAVSGKKKSVMTVLCFMAERIISYSNLYCIIENVCSEAVDVSEELAEKIVFSVFRKKYDDDKIKFVANQVLTAIHDDRLVLNDLLYVPVSLSHEMLLKHLKLSTASKSIYRLIHNLSSSMNGLSANEMIAHAEDIICAYYNADKSRPKVDSLVVQELVRLYVVAYNKQSDKESKRIMLEKIRAVLSVPMQNEIDTSGLFSDESKAILGRDTYWYMVNSSYISRMLLSFCRCDDEVKLDIVFSSGTQYFWWSNAYKGNFAKRLNCVGYVKSNVGLADAEIFLNSLFKEATDATDFMQAMMVLISKEITGCSIDVVIGALLRIIGKDAKLTHNLLKYNEKQIKNFGKHADFTNEHYVWYPNAWFFNYVFGQEWLDKSVNPVLQEIFKNAFQMKPLSVFVSEIYLMESLFSCESPDVQMGYYVSQNSKYFDDGGKIDNGLLIAAYIRTTRSAASITQKIMTQSSYNSSMLPQCNGRNDIFTDRMDYYIFKELSYVIEKNRKRGYSRFTSQKLLYRLLLACGSDFVLDAPQLLVSVAMTLENIDEYRWFTDILMRFYLPVSPELTAALMDAIMRIHENEPKNWLLGKVVARLRAMAGYDLCFNDMNCHAFKAGYFLLRHEQNIDFDHYWAGQSLHLIGKGTEEMVKRIENAGFVERLNAIMAIDSIMLRCEVLLRFYVENGNISKSEDRKIWDKISICFEELAKAFGGSAASRIQISSVINLFTLMTKRSIKVPNSMSQLMLLGLVNFYRKQSENELLGNYYKKNVAYVLDRIKRVCEDSRRVGKSQHVRIHYHLFTNNRAQGKFYFECETEKLYNALK